MAIVTGAVLVLGTWSVCVAALALVGLPLSALSHDRPLSWRDVRRGLWWGLTVTTIVVMLLSTHVALGSGVVLLVLGGVLIVAALVTSVLIRRRGWTGRWHRSPSLGWVLALALAPIGYLAVAALGPVTNFDSGLYHLSAIAHAAEFPAIPGLANLYSPLGYANAGFPLAAAFGSSPWEAEGYRLLNGLMIVLVLADLVIRWAQPRRDAGAYGLLLGAVVLLIPMVALSDYWVTSPSQDSAVFAVTVAVSAMLMTGVTRRGEGTWQPELAASAAIGLLLVLLRPTMGAFLLGVLLVTAIIGWHRRGTRTEWGRYALLVGTTGGAAAAAQVVRDYALSGWLLYPLSLVSFDVPWLASDPVNLRAATLGYHRDPTDLWRAAQGYDWVGAWVGRLPAQWEFWLVLVLALAVVAGILMVRLASGRVRVRGLMLAMTPSVITTIVWWLATPPSFRFAWGPVFTLFTIPLGWLLWRALDMRQARRPRWNVTAWVAAAAVPVLAVTVYSGFARLDVGTINSPRTWTAGISLTYAVAPVPKPQTDPVELQRGLVVQVPEDGAMCWDAFPLCTPETDGRVGYLDPVQGLTGGLSIG
jgi:hypothetical protein